MAESPKPPADRDGGPPKERSEVIDEVTSGEFEVLGSGDDTPSIRSRADSGEERFDLPDDDALGLGSERAPDVTPRQRPGPSPETKLARPRPADPQAMPTEVFTPAPDPQRQPTEVLGPPVIERDERTPRARPPMDGPPLDRDGEPTPRLGAAGTPADDEPTPREDPVLPPVEHEGTPSPVPVLAPAFLLIEKGPGAGSAIPLPEGQLLIGRSHSCGLRLAHSSVSRHHAVLQRRSQRFFVSDAGSHNGTFVNGREITGQQELTEGDRIRLGKTVLVLSSSGANALRGAWGAALGEQPWLLIAVFAVALLVGVGAMMLLARPTRKVDLATPRSASSGAALPTDSPAAGGRVVLAPPRQGEIQVPQQMLSQSGPKAPARPARRDPAPAAPFREPGSEEALAFYETGQIDQAIAAARASGATDVVGQLTAFKGEMASARAELSFDDYEGAIRHFTAALAADEKLSQGWGRYAGEIRLELARLYLRQANGAAGRGERDAALGFAAKALQNDPGLTEAKKLRDRLAAGK